MSKIEDDMISQRDDLSQIIFLMQILINNKVHGNVVARLPGLSKPPDTMGGSVA